MKQWLLLSAVIIFFCLVWGSVLYQLVIKEKSEIYYASHQSEVMISGMYREMTSGPVEFEETSVSELKEFTKSKTEENRLLKPKLEEGIDYGEGISVDDVLENLGVKIINDPS